MEQGELWIAAAGAAIRWHWRPGTGVPLVCLPPISMPARESFEAMVAAPALAGRAVLLVDYLGSGRSDWPEGFDWTPEAHAGTVAAVLDHLGLGGCEVYGHSMGGTVGIALALLRPDLVAGLIVGEGNVAPGGGAVSRRIAGQTLQAFLDDGKARLLADLEAAGTEGGVFVRFAATSWAMASPEGLYGNARGLVDLDPAFLGRFLALGCPRRFVYGAATYPPTTGKVTPDQPDPTALRAAGIGVAVVAGVGHALQIEAPEAVARVIAEEAET